MNKEKKLKSGNLKSDMLAHVLYSLKYEGAVTEYGGKGVSGIADVFAIRKSGFTHEFEVKVAKSDLMGELKSIKHLVKKQLEIGEESSYPEKGSQKYCKHGLYIEGTFSAYSIRHIPNQFSFVVTEELAELAVEGVKGTIYGVYVVTDAEYDNVKCKIRGKRIHNNKAEVNVLRNLLRKASVEVDYLRREKLTWIK